MSRMTKEQIQADEQAVEVVDTNVTCVDNDKATTVTTTLTLRHPVTKKEFQQTTTETRAKAPVADVAPPEPPVPQIVASAPVDPKKLAEFNHVLKELFQTEREFGYRLEAVLIYYEKPVDVSNLLPPMARAVVFGNGSISKLLDLSQRVCSAVEGKGPTEQLMLYRQYLQDSRSYFNDQITSRSLGHVPLQSYLQSNAKFRKFAFAQVPLVEAFLQSKKITTHGHLGSVLYGPVQRLPRVMLLVDRMRQLNPSVEGLSELLAYVKFVLNEFEKNESK